MKWFLVLLMGLGVAELYAQPFPIRSESRMTYCLGYDYYQAQEISMYVNPNMFPNASPEKPNYVLLEFGTSFYNTGFAETLVDLGDEPIFLSAHLLGPQEPGLALNIPPDAVSIIRWRRGEGLLWLRVTSSSCGWVTRNGEPVDCARDDARIAWSFGISEKESETRHRPMYQAGYANRAVNSRADGVPVDTSIILDFTQFEGESLEVFGNEVNYFATDSETEGVETEPDESKIKIGGPSNPTLATFNPYSLILSGGNCTENLYPWVSYNDQFNSKVIANNFSAETARIEFTATRGDGTSYFTTRELPPLGFLAEEPGTLFPDLAKGPGFSLLMRAIPNAAGRWVTFSSGSGSGRSPSQGTAVQLNDPSNITAPESTPDDPNALLFGYLPLSDGFSSAPVVVNAGVLPVDVTLYFYDQAGNLILRNDSLIKDLRAYRPFAVPTAELLPGHTGDVQMIAYTTDGPINGAVFTFNTALETAIGNAQPIRFDPAEAAKQRRDFKP